MFRLGNAVQRHAAIATGVIIGQDINHGRGIFVQGLDVIDRNRYIINGTNRQADRRRRGVAIGVRDRISEAVGAVIIGGRGVLHLAINNRDRAMFRLGNAVQRHAAIATGVIIGQDINHGRGIFVQGLDVINRNRHIINRINRQADRRRRGVAVGVRNRIGE